MVGWDMIAVLQMFAGEGLAEQLRKHRFCKEIKRAEIQRKKRAAEIEALANYRAGPVGIRSVTTTPDNTPDNTWRGTWQPTPRFVAPQDVANQDVPVRIPSYHELAFARTHLFVPKDNSTDARLPRENLRGHASATVEDSSDAGFLAENAHSRASAVDAEMLRAKLAKLATERAERVEIGREEAKAAKEAYVREMQDSPWGMPCPHYKCFCGGKTEESREFRRTGTLPPEPKFVNQQDRVKAFFALEPSTTRLDDGCLVVKGFVPGVPIPYSAITTAESSPRPTASKRRVARFDVAAPKVRIVPARDTEDAENAIMTDDEESDHCNELKRKLLKHRKAEEARRVAYKGVRPSRDSKLPSKGILKAGF